MTTAQQAFHKPGRISMAEVAALCKDCPIDDMVGQIAAALPGAKVMAIQQVVKSRMEMLAQFTHFSYGISAVILFIGGLVVLVTMMGSVRERTDEIGIFRAIGSRRSHIMRIVFLEAALVSVLLCIDVDVPSSLENFNKDGKVIEKNLPRVEFCHWVMVDIPPRDGAVAEGECSDGITARGKKNPKGPPGSRHGINEYTGFMASDPDMAGDYFGYEGPCSPWNDERIHQYHFILYATDLERFPVEGRFTGADVQKAIGGHVLAEARLTGTYTLNPRLL